MKNRFKFKKVILIVLAIAWSYVASAQDTRLTQALSAPLTLNPAMMGLNSDIHFIAQYRNQWGSVSSGYSTYSFTSLVPIYKQMDGANKVDIGFNATNDVAGAYNALNLSLAAGYNLKISESSFLNVSFMGGMVQRVLNTNSLSFDEQYVVGSYSATNPNNETIVNKKTSFMDISAGAIWYSAPVKINLGKERNVSAYLGGSAFHLNTPPNESFSGGTASLPMRLSYQAGVKVISEKVDITPVIYANYQDGNNNTAVGLLVDYRMDTTNKISLGMWVREKDAIAFCAGYTWLNFRMMYSYDVSATSPINNSVSRLGAHEFTLAVKFNKAQQKGVKLSLRFYSY
jgi:type IX secretion system PorP/SprF family membrane protein